MLRDPASSIRSTLAGLRSVFLGAASRHDGMRSRWVIAEADYNTYLQGPNDAEWAQDKLIASRGYTLRHPTPYRVSPEQQQQILKERPDAKFGSFERDNEVFYIVPLINSNFLFRGDLAGRDAFTALSHDAGFCLLQLLQIRKLSLKLPELVPYDTIASVQSRKVSTNLPSDLDDRWLAFLHILGWQNLSFSPLRAERSIWHKNTSILGDPGELQSALGTPMFEKLREKIPFPARYFASTMRTDMNLASVYAIDAILAGMINLPTIDVARFTEALASIPPGREDAASFHKLVKEVLAIIFQPDLHSPASEEKLHEGRGRIDIVFTNAAERGYFADLPFRHNIKCPIVFFECKNYSSDVTGPEFAQLASRFSDNRSNVGFIVCRTIDDKKLVRDRCRDRFQDKLEHVLVLDDEDLVGLLKLKSEGNAEAISQYLHAKFRPVFMDA